MEIDLSAQEEIFLKTLHRSQKKKRQADRIKTILLLYKGFTQKEVAEILLLDENTIGQNKKNYLNRKDDKTWYLDHYMSYIGKLSYIQISLLLQYCDNFKVSNKSEIKKFIEKSFNVFYKKSGLQKLLNRIGLSYSQLHRFSGKADINKQQDFITEFEKISDNLTEKQTIVFIDSTHPLHNSISSKIWKRIGQIRWINSNTGRKRVNINGAYNLFNQDVIIRLDNTIDTNSTIKLLHQISEKYKHLETVYVFADNARSNKNKAVFEWLKTQKRIKMKFIPPYSPNLNLIERLWKYMRKNIIHTKFYPAFSNFKDAISYFFENIHLKKQELAQFIGMKFQTFENIKI